MELAGVTDLSGDSLNNVGVDLNSGSDLGAPYALGGTNGAGAFDLLVPAASVGASVPNSATFEISTLDENGDMVTAHREFREHELVALDGQLQDFV